MIAGNLSIEQRKKSPFDYLISIKPITVWGALSSEGILGPVFFDGTVDGNNYLNMLCNVEVPQLRTRANFAELYFQQDGATPHYALFVRNYLDNIFPLHWIGQRGSTDWPSRSPLLTPMDFIFWGIVKNKVHERKPQTVVSNCVSKCFG
jgi:hypothetical protein